MANARRDHDRVDAIHMSKWQNDRDHHVAAKDFPLSKRLAPRLGCIAWFVAFASR
jgi:hypothetical protein